MNKITPIPPPSLQDHAQRHALAGQAPVRISLQALQKCLFVTSWDETTIRVHEALAVHVGAAGAGRPRKVSKGSGGFVLHLEPHTYALVGAQPITFSHQLACITDQTQAFQHIVVTGEDAAEFLNCNLALDLRDTSFPILHAASTAIHGMPVHIWREQASFNILVPRSFALSLWAILRHSLDGFTPVFSTLSSFA